LAIEDLAVENLELIDVRKPTMIKAIFDLRIAGLGVVRECRYVVRQDGRSTVHGPSVLAEHGGYPKFVVFDPAAANRITELVRDQYQQATAC
jgi:hypothetical protein